MSTKAPVGKPLALPCLALPTDRFSILDQDVSIAVLSSRGNPQKAIPLQLTRGNQNQPALVHLVLLLNVESLRGEIQKSTMHLSFQSVPDV